MRPGAAELPSKTCPACGDTFWTQVGLDEHVRLGRHDRYTRRWISGRFGPAGLIAQQERGRQVAALNNTRRRRCDGCGHISTLAGVGAHQKSSGHFGWSEIVAA